MNNKFNEYEKALIAAIQEAERYVKGELEMQCHDGDWFAWDYREEYEAAFSMEVNDYHTKPIISKETIKKHNVNVIKCLDYCNVYYVE